ncbi:hypothetical protein OROMI_027363 [Orobanche minor]
MFRTPIIAGNWNSPSRNHHELLETSVLHPPHTASAPHHFRQSSSRLHGHGVVVVQFKVCCCSCIFDFSPSVFSNIDFFQISNLVLLPRRKVVAAVNALLPELALDAVVSLEKLLPLLQSRWKPCCRRRWST